VVDFRVELRLSRHTQVDARDVDVATKRRIIVVRHCVRSTSEHWTHKYHRREWTSKSLPDFGVPSHWCTVNGDEIARKVGEELVNKAHVDLDLPLRITADATSRRDWSTANQLVQGIIKASVKAEKPEQWPVAVESDGVLFTASRRKIWNWPLLCAFSNRTKDRQARRDSTTARLLSLPQPSTATAVDYNATLSWAVGKLGIGSRGSPFNLKRIEPASVNKEGFIGGGVDYIRYAISQATYLYWSGNNFFNSTEQELRDIMQWYYWNLAVVHGPENMMNNIAMLDDILADLDSNQPGATVHVGHDGTQGGLSDLLSLMWAAPPFETPMNVVATPPTGSLLFEKDLATGEVTVKFGYPDLWTSWLANNSSPTHYDVDFMSHGQVNATVDGKTTSTVAALKALADKNMKKHPLVADDIKRCFESAARRRIARQANQTH